MGHFDPKPVLVDGKTKADPQKKAASKEFL
jgi:hypothetical protein